MGDWLELPLDAHKEEAFGGVLVLVGVEDVRAVREEQAGDGGDEALAVRAGDEEDGGWGHLGARLPDLPMVLERAHARGVTHGPEVLRLLFPGLITAECSRGRPS